MSTRKLGVAMGAAVLLLGMPTSYALAGAEDKPDKPDKQAHQCEDGVDNDPENADGADYPTDPDCGSPRDNSEGPEEGEEPGGEEPGGGLPALPELPVDPAELQALIEELTGDLPPGGGEPPALPVDPAELEALIEELTGDLPPGGGEPPAPPALPTPEDLQQAVEELIPPPPLA